MSAAPGGLRRALAARLVGEAVAARVFDPLLADAHAEWREARAAGRPWRARAAWAAGLGAYAVALALTAPPALAASPCLAAVAAVAAALLGVGVVRAAGVGDGLARAQAAYLAAGVAVMAALAARPRRAPRAPAVAWALAGAGLLGATLVAGEAFDGARRWLALGALRVHPGELCKPLVVLALASHLGRGRAPWGAVALGALFVVPALLQPDAATALVFVAAVAAALAAGARPARGPLAACALAAGVIAVALARAAPGDALARAATRHTDLVVAVVAQRAGAAGVLAVLGALGVVAYAARSTTRRSPDGAARVAGAAVAGAVLAQVALHVAGASGLAATGAALPGVSYGGSALVGLLAAVGVVLRLARTPPAPGPGSRAW